jgi:hypothetical protein
MRSRQFRQQGNATDRPPMKTWMPPCMNGLKKGVTKISQLVDQF